MNVSIKKTHAFKNSNPIHTQNTSFTPTKRFPITSPISIISNAKIEINHQEITQNMKKPLIKSNANNNFIKSLKSPLTATEPRNSHISAHGLQRIKEVKENHLELANEKKIRRLTEQLETFSPKFIKSKDVVLDKIDLDFKAKFFKIKKTVPEVNNEDLETSKNSVKSFRIRNKRSISDIRENSINIGQSINKQQILINQKMEMKAMLTNKHLLHNKMQKRPDTTGAKNRDKKFVVIEKTQQKLQEDKDSNSNIIVDNNKIITKIDIALHKSNNEKEINKNIDIQVNEKENFKEELNEKQKCDHEEAKNQINNPLDIKKEFSTDLFDEFKFGELLGEGAYAQVFKVLLPKKGNFIAVKVIKLIKGSDEKCSEQLKQLRNEIGLLQRLNHLHIVSYLDCKQQKDNFYIFMEHLSGGSISSMLKQYGRFDEQVIRKFVKQLLEGLEYLHSQGVVHSDLKGANILSDGCGNVKLADFGASRHLENLPLLSITGSYLDKSAKGSLYWMAPEIFNQEKHGRKIDIWSLGCTVIEMASAKHPWPDCKSFTELVVQVMTLKCPPIPDHLSNECKDFIRQCCIFDRTARPSAKELFGHIFLNEK